MRDRGSVRNPSGHAKVMYSTQAVGSRVAVPTIRQGSRGEVRGKNRACRILKRDRPGRREAVVGMGVPDARLFAGETPALREATVLGTPGPGCLWGCRMLVCLRARRPRSGMPLGFLAAPFDTDIRRRLRSWMVASHDVYREIPAMPAFVIGIAGPSGSGKSSLTEGLVQRLGDRLAVLELDAYYREKQEVDQLRYGHDHPQAVDLDAFHRDLLDLREGREVNVPVYDFASHSRSGERLQPARPVIVVEGLYVFWHQGLREAIDHRVWVEAPPDQLVHRRLQRDVHPPRNRLPADIKERIETCVMPAFHEFGQACAGHAHVVLRNVDPQRHALRQTLDELVALPAVQAALEG